MVESVLKLHSEIGLTSWIIFVLEKNIIIILTRKQLNKKTYPLIRWNLVLVCELFRIGDRDGVKVEIFFKNWRRKNFLIELVGREL